MGLAIVKEIVHLLKGRSSRKEYGKGSTFTLFLPCRSGKLTLFFPKKEKGKNFFFPPPLSPPGF
ncbi:MAG: hypothetical protein MPW16_01905 [Candidatus Manganitrophus sp.]|nr:MAG: hypothetical protein MPW16_01905 [Candidatus Manganitrophus sp.]